MKKKKSNLVNYIIIVVVLIACVVYMLVTEGVDSMAYALSRLNYLWIAVGLLMMLVYWTSESMALYVYAKKIAPDVSFGAVFRVTMIGQLFNCITPFASGGQPMQAFYLSKSRMTVAQALTALLSRFIVYQGTLTILSALIIIFRYDYFSKTISGFLSLALIGFIINSIVIVCLLLIGYCKSLVLAVLRWAVKLGSKIRWRKGHIVNDPDATYRKASEGVESFSENMKFVRKNLGMSLRSMFWSLVQLLAYFTLPFFIGLAFGDTANLDFFNMLCAQAFVLMISSFIPSPGAAGAAEVSFVLFFKSFMLEGTVPYAMLVWRLFVFYLPIVVGALFLRSTEAKDGPPPEEVRA